MRKIMPVILPRVTNSQEGEEEVAAALTNRPEH